jgi:predicted transcriptional regulator
MARIVGASGGQGESRFSIVLGIDAGLAGELAQARGHSLRQEEADWIGPGCRGCFVADCRQRSFPPRGRALAFDPLQHSATPFEFARSGEPGSENDVRG